MLRCVWGGARAQTRHESRAHRSFGAYQECPAPERLRGREEPSFARGLVRPVSRNCSRSDRPIRTRPPTRIAGSWRLSIHYLDFRVMRNRARGRVCCVWWRGIRSSHNQSALTKTTSVPEPLDLDQSTSQLSPGQSDELPKRAAALRDGVRRAKRCVSVGKLSPRGDVV
jgi:hypothetical protein